MAKAPAIEGYSKDPMGAGWKKCPQCEGYVKGPVTKECPNCHHLFEFKSRTVKKPVASTVDREQQMEQQVMLLALKMGGLQNVTKAVQKLAADPLVAFTIRCGGVDNTLRIVGAIEGKLSSFEPGQ
ncbi:hypothetical protein [Planctomyces sp. SH-PL14]|jgi:hypothetical protein|uniref:hypothetical protein n=1 Tax=Planctomyces sp. SH-PL14 TaxID=1632864 RepID=UPI00078DD37E|nr:hypothetical protein [Planctomyces sp. SH-PL14]AMV21522.1 hypothetical protein VT03_26705 [Planctomyces sp. SH-PL14]